MLQKRLLQCHAATIVCRACRLPISPYAGQRREQSTDAASWSHSDSTSVSDAQIQSSLAPSESIQNRDDTEPISPAKGRNTRTNGSNAAEAAEETVEEDAHVASVAAAYTDRLFKSRQKSLKDRLVPAQNKRTPKAQANNVHTHLPPNITTQPSSQSDDAKPDTPGKASGEKEAIPSPGQEVASANGNGFSPKPSKSARYRANRRARRAVAQEVIARAIANAARHRTEGAKNALREKDSAVTPDEQRSRDLSPGSDETDAAPSKVQVLSRSYPVPAESEDATGRAKRRVLRRQEVTAKTRPASPSSPVPSSIDPERRNTRARVRNVRVDGNKSKKSKSPQQRELRAKSIAIEGKLGVRTAAKASTVEPLTKLGVRVLDKADSITALDHIQQPPVPRLAHGLDRVLFNPGIYQLQDPRSYVYNFDPYLEHIMPVGEFDFSALKAYKTSSEDTTMSDLARTRNKKYYGSTSSMTAVLSQFHYLISHFRRLKVDMLSRSFSPDSLRQTAIARAPASIFLRYKDGIYAIDADKEYDTPNVLMMLGKSMEKLLTMSQSEFERYRKSNPEKVPEEERSVPEPFQFTELGDLLMRSQLDAQDSRLPGTGTFDLKTRCVVSKRMDMNSEESTGYEIRSLDGQFESYEREYYDMMRAVMLKYMLQVRMGRMDGIFVAYHNIQRIFGFQYVSLQDMDLALHSQQTTDYGWMEYEYSLRMLNDVLNQATKKFPEQSLRILVEAEGDEHSVWCGMRIFAEPITEAQIDEVQRPVKEAAAEYERRLMADEPLESVSSPSLNESADATVVETSKEFFEKTDGSPKPTKEQKPLYAAVIVTESRVDGRRVVRSKTAKDWKLSYEISEFPEARTADAWHLYKQTRLRREKTFLTHAASDGIGVDGQISPKVADYYIQLLRKLSKEGRDYRAARIEKTKDRPVEVWAPSGE